VGNIEDILDLLYVGKKGRYLNTVENYYMYLETKKNNQINLKIMVNNNLIFSTVVQYDLNGGQHL
jgi:hypothetical protein